MKFSYDDWYLIYGGNQSVNMYDLIMKSRLNFPIFGDVFDIMSNNKLISY